MENDATDRARAALRTVPAFAGLDPERVGIERQVIVQCRRQQHEGYRLPDRMTISRT